MIQEVGSDLEIAASFGLSLILVARSRPHLHIPRHRLILSYRPLLTFLESQDFVSMPIPRMDISRSILLVVTTSCWCPPLTKPNDGPMTSMYQTHQIQLPILGRFLHQVLGLACSEYSVLLPVLVP